MVPVPVPVLRRSLSGARAVKSGEQGLGQKNPGNRGWVQKNPGELGLGHKILGKGAGAKKRGEAIGVGSFVRWKCRSGRSLGALVESEREVPRSTSRAGDPSEL